MIVTVKPISLMEYLIRIYSPVNNSIRSFCGSGTTGVAALQQDRKFVGIDLSSIIVILLLKELLIWGTLKCSYSEDSYRLLTTLTSIPRSGHIFNKISKLM